MRPAIYLFCVVFLFIGMVNFIVLGIEYVTLGRGLHPFIAVPAAILCVASMFPYLSKFKESVDVGNVES